MSHRRPELPYTGTTNTLAARTSPCPPVPWTLAAFSAVAVRLVEAEIQQAMRRTPMPPPQPPVAEWSHAVRATVLWSVAWAGILILAGVKLAAAISQIERPSDRIRAGLGGAGNTSQGPNPQIDSTDRRAS